MKTCRIVVLVGALLLAFATTADAKPSATTTTTTGVATPPIIPAPSGPSTSPTSPTVINYGPGASLPVPNGADPECKVAGLSPEAQRACAGSGSALAPFPSGNYGLDIHVDGSLFDPPSWWESTVQNLAGTVIGIIVDVLGTVFGWLGAAFGFDLFSSDRSGQIPGALRSISGSFTSPFLPAALGVAGLWALHHWLKHSEAKAIGHLVATVLLIVVAAVLIADPVGVLGDVDRDANAISGDVLSVFATGKVGSGAFASAEPGLWKEGVERPWCALEFGKDTTWCMSPIGGETAAWRSAVLANVAKADANSTPQVQADERRRLGLARTNGELWLAFPPNDDARNGKNDSWTLYHNLLAKRPELAQIRGSGGVGARAGTLAIVLFGIIPFLLLLLYVALHLLAAAIAFVLFLLLAPVAILFPPFGDSGRSAFAKWGGALAISLMLKVGYAACLGALILTSGMLATLVAGIGGGWALGWGMWALLWLMAWIHRGKLLQAFTLGMHKEAHSMVVRRHRPGRHYARRARRLSGIGVRELPPAERDWIPWRRPGEWAPANRPMRVPNFADSQPRVIEGSATTVLPRAEPPALTAGSNE